MIYCVLSVCVLGVLLRVLLRVVRVLLRVLCLLCVCACP